MVCVKSIAIQAHYFSEPRARYVLITELVVRVLFCKHLVYIKRLAIGNKCHGTERPFTENQDPYNSMRGIAKRLEHH